MSSLIVFDTSIFVDHRRLGLQRERLDSLIGLIRTSAVVLAELWRGASRPAGKTFMKELEKNHPLLTPTEKNWLESGQLLGRMQADRGFSIEKPPLTCREGRGDGPSFPSMLPQRTKY